jgi:hypothetical protein
VSLIASPAADARVAATARRQHGLITSLQAHAAGLTPDQITWRHQTGRWRSVGDGLWVIAGLTFTWHTSLMAACVATRGVASHRSAAILHGTRAFGPGRPEVTVVRSRRSGRSSCTVHRSTDLEDQDCTTVDGIPVTTTARLAVDLGAVVPYFLYEQVVDDLLTRRLLTWDDLALSVVRVARRGRRGVGPARQLLLDRIGEDLTESRLERLFLRLARSTGLPEPVPQHEVGDDGGFIARVDFAYPAQRVAIELDGRRHHIAPAAFERDRWKRNRLQLLGWDVLAYTWAQIVNDGAAVARQVQQALKRGTDLRP